LRCCEQAAGNDLRPPSPWFSDADSCGDVIFKAHRSGLKDLFPNIAPESMQRTGIRRLPTPHKKTLSHPFHPVLEKQFLAFG
jgi:hypothetical protein